MAEILPPPDDKYSGRIAIKPHLLRYVQWREGLRDEHSALIVPGLGPIAEVLSILLVSDREYLNARPLTSVEGYTAVLHYAVLERSTSPARRFVTDEGTRHFNRYLQQLLNDDIYFRAKEAARQRIQQKTVIEEFLAATGLDEWLEFDSMPKSQTRLKQLRSGASVQGYSRLIFAWC